MANKIHNVKIINSPFHPNIEVAGDLVIKLHVPYSDENVTVKINPNLVAYNEKISDNLRQYTKSFDTKDTKTLTFDFQKNNVNNITFANKSYEIKLMTIGKISEQGQNFPTFEFAVNEK